MPKNSPFVLLLLIIWGVMQWNGLANRHHHIDSKGNLISHAHPVQDGEGDHDHTSEEFVFLELISNPLFQLAHPETCVPINLEVQFFIQQPIYSSFAIEKRESSSDFLRGPPFIS